MHCHCWEDTALPTQRVQGSHSWHDIKKTSRTEKFGVTRTLQTSFSGAAPCFLWLIAFLSPGTCNGKRFLPLRSHHQAPPGMSTSQCKQAERLHSLTCGPSTRHLVLCLQVILSQKGGESLKL